MSSLSPPHLAFLAGDFHARSRFARSTIPEEKWGLLVVYPNTAHREKDTTFSNNLLTSDNLWCTVTFHSLKCLSLSSRSFSNCSSLFLLFLSSSSISSSSSFNSSFFSTCQGIIKITVTIEVCIIILTA